MAKQKPDPKKYDAHRDSMAEQSRESSAAGRDIGALPAVVNQARRGSCASNLRLFCETYFAPRFFMVWSADHLKVLGKLESCILTGGIFALAMPRGSGKTAIAEAAALWAVLYGHRRFVVLIGATDEAALELLDSIKMAVETNDLIGDDFPEACFPVREMEGINNRAGGQTIGGERTRITWTADEAVFPTVKGSLCSGSRIRVAGILGRLRGMKAATADGQTIRPDFAIPDDPQTDASAVSLPDIAKRERRLRGAIKGLAGPGKTIAMFVPCTVIAPNDLSDRLLNRDRNPQFQGEKMRMVYSFPTSEERWDRYAELRNEAQKADDPAGKIATEYYAANREAMDAGCVVAWESRYDPAIELSAVQAAMNLKTDNPEEFWAEYQNEPRETAAFQSVKELVAATIAAKLNNVPRFEVPRECTRLTAFVDCGGLIHWYVVLAHDERFNSSVVDYGTFPKQNRAYFEKSDPRPSMKDVGGWEKYSEPQRVYGGVRAVTDEILSRVYIRAGTGEAMKIGRCLVDAGQWAETVRLACRDSAHAAVLTASKGWGRSGQSRAISEWSNPRRERTGLHWRMTSQGAGKLCMFDTDMWKSFVADRLLTPPGGIGCMALFGTKGTNHEMFADHLTAEYGAPAVARGTTYIKWSVRPDRRDNDWFDCLVGATVAASVDGLVWADSPGPVEPRKPRKRINIEELYAAQNKGDQQ